MIELLPYYYRKSQVVNDLYNVITTALTQLNIDVSDLDRDMFISTTLDFDRHEADVGLTSINADADTKRARVTTRLSGSNMMTLSELKNIISNYDKTGCTIKEDYQNYTVTIIFSGRKGVPYNLEQIQSTIDELKPAHIKINYEYMKNTWNDAHKKIGTWSNASSYTWESAAYYDGRTWLYVDRNNDVYLQDNGANAYVIYVNNNPYAKLL